MQAHNEEAAGIATTDTDRLLLSFAKALHNVKSRYELLDFIVKELQPVFGFNQYTNITTLSNDGSSLQLLFSHMTEADKAPDELKPFLGVFPLEGIFKAIMATDDVIVIDESWKTAPKNTLVEEQSAAIWRSLDLKYCLSTSLRSFDKLVGTFHVHFFEPRNFNSGELALFRSVANLIAVTVDNILSVEALSAKEQENARLLTVSEALATVRNPGELWQVILETIKPIFNFDDGVIAVVDNDQRFQHVLASSLFVRGESTQHFINELSAYFFPIDDFFDTLLTPNKVTIFDPEEEHKRYGYDYLDKMVQAGIRETMCIPLFFNGQLLGGLYLHSTKKDHFRNHSTRLFRHLANQIGVAVKNILTKEEIQRREAEKSILLSLSEQIATIRDRDDLWQFLREKVQPIMEPDAMAIVKIDNATKTYCHLFTNEQYPEIRSNPLFQKHMGKPSDIEGSPYQPLAESVNPKPIFWDLEQAAKTYPTHWGVLMCAELGLKQNLWLPLRQGGKLLGTLEFVSIQKDKYTAAHIPIAQAIADHLAGAVANILANEELQTRAAEISELNVRLKQQNAYLVEEVEAKYNFGEFVGDSPAIMDIYKSISLVARTESTVLIMGETGTGKELVARAIHNNSDRAHKTLIKINCAALPAQLIESELFGHERGAFTGAIERRIGKFELANGSTLFLDEIGELPLDLQAKLLRALQEREIERLGSNKVMKIDVRVIAATNRVLAEEVRNKRFRQDLYFRLNVFPILVPPLRERPADIQALAHHFLKIAAKKSGNELIGFSKNAMQQMDHYDWPGNIRELEHLIERAAILERTKVIQSLYLPETRMRLSEQSPANFSLRSMQDHEKEYIFFVLNHCRHRIYGPGGAAEILGLAPSTLQSRIKKLGIQKRHMPDQAN